TATGSSDRFNLSTRAEKSSLSRLQPVGLRRFDFFENTLNKTLGGGDRKTMAARFVNLDRQTPMFLPCDLRDWVPATHIVHFILDAVEHIATAHFHVNHRGTGSEQYPA